MSIHIKNFLSTCLQSHSWRMDLLKQWPEIMGNLSTKVFIEKIDGSILTLSVIDSCWLQELYILSPLLLDTINQTLDQPYIKQLRFKKAGERPSMQTKKIEPTRHTKQVYMTSAEKRALEGITNPELRNALEAFCLRCHRERS